MRRFPSCLTTELQKRHGNWAENCGMYGTHTYAYIHKCVTTKQSKLKGFLLTYLTCNFLVSLITWECDCTIDIWSYQLHGDGQEENFKLLLHCYEDWVKSSIHNNVSHIPLSKVKKKNWTWNGPMASHHLSGTYQIHPQYQYSEVYSRSARFILKLWSSWTNNFEIKWIQLKRITELHWSVLPKQK